MTMVAVASDSGRPSTMANDNGDSSGYYCSRDDNSNDNSNGNDSSGEIQEI